MRYSERSCQIVDPPGDVTVATAVAAYAWLCAAHGRFKER